MYLFIGWENSAALAEETGNPRRNVPRAVYLSIAMMVVSATCLFAFATVTGFGYNGTKLAAAPIPFITVAHNALAGFAFFAYLAGLTSTLGVLISAVNSQARLIFNAGREGLLPPLDRQGAPRPQDTDERHLRLRGDRQRHHCGVGTAAPARRPQSGSMVALNFFVESSTHRAPSWSWWSTSWRTSPSLLLPQVPASRVQRAQARQYCRCSG